MRRNKTKKQTGADLVEGTKARKIKYSKHFYHFLKLSILQCIHRLKKNLLLVLINISQSFSQCSKWHGKNKEKQPIRCVTPIYNCQLSSITFCPFRRSILVRTLNSALNKSNANNSTKFNFNNFLIKIQFSHYFDKSYTNIYIEFFFLWKILLLCWSKWRERIRSNVVQMIEWIEETNRMWYQILIRNAFAQHFAGEFMLYLKHFQ